MARPAKKQPKQKAIDDRNYSCGIFLDFSKAFDTINHNILIRKLQHYGVRGLALDWFISYLSNRNQVVTVNGVQSELVYHVEFLKDLFSAQYYFCYILMIFIRVPSYLISICLQMMPTCFTKTKIFQSLRLL